MARRLRLELAGGVYHVVSRGNRGQALFADEQDHRTFLQALGDACGKTRWMVKAYCLMPDHLHLVLATPEPNLVTGMKWLLGTYAGRCNRRYQLRGHLFANRYRSLIIDPQNDYIQSVADYVHLNPSRAALLSAGQSLSDYPWSSLGEFLSAPRARCAWVNVDTLLGVHGLFPDTAQGRQKLKDRMERLRALPEPTEFAQIRRGWCFGTVRFKRKLLLRVSARAGRHHYGAEIQEAAEARAEALVNDALKALGWKQGELAARPKGDRQKVQIARRLRKQSSVTLSWIAQRLQMGTHTYLAHLLYWYGRERPPKRKLPESEGRLVDRQQRRRGKPSKKRAPKILLTDPLSSPPEPGPAPFVFDPTFD